MPGAPPVNVLSVTDIRGTPFSRKEIVLPTGHQLQLRPGRQRRGAVRAKLGPVARVPLEQHQLGAAEIPEVDADVAILPAALEPHRRADPHAPRQLRRGDLNLGVLITGKCFSRADLTRGHVDRPRHRLRRDRHRAIRDSRPVRPKAAIGPVEIIRSRQGPGGSFMRKHKLRRYKKTEDQQQPQRPQDLRLCMIKGISEHFVPPNLGRINFTCA